MDTLHVPYKAGAFDVVLSIAVLHHLSTPERRTQALSELLRIARKGFSFAVLKQLIYLFFLLFR
jgi:2-polyprenyl-3-methyl-5-hydroxy-6-metoxy-1,4-benzoquinol methylase